MFIAVTGPESSGKTTLAHYLGEALPALVVEEQSRRILERLTHQYQLQDILNIGRAQFQAVINALEVPDAIVVSDTFMIELKVWTEVRFDGEPDEIAQLRRALVPDLYVLCMPDIPWEPDPVRENPHDRDELFKLYQRYVRQSGVPVFVARDSGPQRMIRVLDELRARIKK